MKTASRLILDAHMHCWDHVHGLIGNEVPVRPLDRGRIRVGDDVILGMPASFLDCRATAERVLAEWDAHGVTGGVLVQEYLDGEQNAYSRSVQAQYPDRFRAYALPDFFAVDAVADEAIALLEGGGFCGVKVCGGHLEGKVALDDERLFPLYAWLDEHASAVALDFAEGEAQVAEFERVLARWPELRVAVGHFAMPTRGGWPAQLHLARHPNVLVESGGIVWLYRGEGPPFPSARDALLRARDEVGIDKLMWGSDWPRTMCDFTYEQSFAFVRDGDFLTEEEKDAFLGGNAARFYGFPSPDPLPTPVPPITTG